MANTKLLQPGGGASEGSSDEQNVSIIQEDVVDLNETLPSFADLLPEQAQPYWQFVQKYPLIEWVAIFCIFFALAYLIRRYAIQLIVKLTAKTEGTLDDQIIADLRAPIFSTVVWLGVIMASTSAGLSEGWAGYIAPVVLSIIVLNVTRAALSVSGNVITSLSRDEHNFKQFDVRTEPLLIIVSKILILLICAYAVLTIWGINPVGLLASAGIVGIAVGFAAKDTLANLFSGVFILADRPYKLGDYINLDSGERGKVTHIGIRSTRLLTRDDVEVTIPNGVIGNSKVVNESGGSHQKMRIRLSVQCAYDADLDRLVEVLVQVANEQEGICQFPSPNVRVQGFGESGINVQLRGWIEHPEQRGRVSHLTYMAIHKAFKEHNLEIPFPKRDINIIREE